MEGREEVLVAYDFKDVITLEGRATTLECIQYELGALLSPCHIHPTCQTVLYFLIAMTKAVRGQFMFQTNNL